MAPAIVLLVVLIYFIVFLISYIKKPYLYLIKFEDDYVELTKDRGVFYKDISYVLTDGLNKRKENQCEEILF